MARKVKMNGILWLMKLASIISLQLFQAGRLVDILQFEG